jgi:mono/diheme cytochrome c family protein
MLNRAKYLSAFLALSLLPLTAGGPRLLNAQTQINKNFPRQDWQPTRAIYGWRYLGDKTCAACHAAEARTQTGTAMALALSAVSDCQVLRSHPNLHVRLGRYDYRITTVRDRATYRVSDGRKSIAAPLLYALGRGDAGQTYLFSYQGAFYESQVSYFNAIRSLDLTLGHSAKQPPSLEAALGLRLSHDDALRCFACHSTAAVSNSSMQLGHMIPGITCEGCHGPGSGHVAAVKSGNLTNLHIFNPGRLSSSDLMDFCGSCHRTALDVASLNVSGVRTIRFQPYRLFLSRCFVSSNGGVSCLTCHNPHQRLQHSEIFYDAKCIGCHSRQHALKRNSGFAVAVCPVSKKNCIACHMPKYGLPGGHFRFTDHDIRVVRARERYPG